jgi:glycosidase
LAGNTAQYKLAAATYLLQPGTPFIYYGEEVGMAGVKGLAGDAPLRAPMSWDADGRAFSPDPNPSTGTQAAPFRPFSPNAARQNAQDQARDPASLLNFYKAMLKLRNSRPSISSGSYDAATAKGQVLTFQRRSGQEITLIAINYGLQPVSSSVGALPARAHLRALYPLSQAKTNSGRANQAGAVTLSLPAQSVSVYQVGR